MAKKSQPAPQTKAQRRAEQQAADQLDAILSANKVSCDHPGCSWSGGSALLGDHKAMAH